MAIFLFFKMAAAAILDFWNFKFFTVGTVKSVELHHLASEWVSSFLTAHKHYLGHLVPLQVKNQESWLQTFRPFNKEAANNTFL